MSDPDSVQGRTAAWSVVRAAVTAVLVAGLALVAFVLLARFVGFTRGPLAFAIALVPWWTLAAALATVILLLLGRRALAVCGIALTFIGLATVVPVLVPQPEPAAPTDAISVMSINMTKGAADVDAIVALARERDVDVLAVQEITPQGESSLRAAGIDRLLPYSFVVAQGSALGTGLWSAEPLSSKRQLDGFVFRQLVAVASFDNQRATIVSAHPRPPSSRLSGRWRTEQQLLLSEVSQIGGPALLVGDLNATSDHPELRELTRRGWSEARDQAGAGLVLTFPTVALPVPVAALDRSYVKETGWVARSITAYDIPEADHRAIVVDYVSTSPGS